MRKLYFSYIFNQLLYKWKKKVSSEILDYT